MARTKHSVPDNQRSSTPPGQTHQNIRLVPCSNATTPASAGNTFYPTKTAPGKAVTGPPMTRTQRVEADMFETRARWPFSRVAARVLSGGTGVSQP